jgi:hypothetical protein
MTLSTFSCVVRANPADVRQDPDKQLVPWWQLKPKQSSPPRQTLMHPPGEVARFVADQAIYSNKVRSGKSTQVGGELDIPQVGRNLPGWRRRLNPFSGESIQW